MLQHKLFDRVILPPGLDQIWHLSIQLHHFDSVSSDCLVSGITSMGYTEPRKLWNQDLLENAIFFQDQHIQVDLIESKC